MSLFQASYYQWFLGNLMSKGWKIPSYFSEKGFLWHGVGLLTCKLKGPSFEQVPSKALGGGGLL